MKFFDRFTKKNKKTEFGNNKQQVKVGSVGGTGSASSADKRDLPVQKTKKNLAHSNAHRVLLHPLISEKAAHAEANNVYTFVVSRSATKDAVKQAVKDVYGIAPIKIRVINTEGKIARHGRSIGRRSDWRKALVTLPKGQTIGVHEGV